MNWHTQGVGPIWVPVLNSCEVSHGIPTDLLARLAFQESSFRPDVVSGEIRSAAGAVGIMQLLPRYFPNAGLSPSADIETAGSFLTSLCRDGDWQAALASYNWGAGNVHRVNYVLADMPTETQNYVKDICADVPVSGALLV